jgi:hypothetical protein
VKEMLWQPLQVVQKDRDVDQEATETKSQSEQLVRTRVAAHQIESDHGL